MRYAQFGGYKIIIEVTIVTIVIVIFLFLLQPVVIYSQSRRATASSNIRQLATAFTMYAQEHNDKFPDADWIGAMEIPSSANYITTSDNSSTEDNTTIINYGYNGQLVDCTGKGIHEDDISSPTEVALCAESFPGKKYPMGGLLNGGALLPKDEYLVQPRESTDQPRHKGYIIGYCDGHASYSFTSEKERSVSAISLGVEINTSGGISKFNFPKLNDEPIEFEIGGDYSTLPILTSAATIWQNLSHNQTFTTKGFNGAYSVNKRSKNFIWGYSDRELNDNNTLAIAKACQIIAIPVNTILKQHYPKKVHKDTLNLTKSDLVAIFNGHSGIKDLHIYTFNRNSGSRYYFAHKLREWGATKGCEIIDSAVVVSNDKEMVSRINGDPNGIGYCSSVFINNSNDSYQIRAAAIDGHFFPCGQMADDLMLTPGTIPDDWPLTQTLYIKYGGKVWNKENNGIVNVMLTPRSEGYIALHEGPLFRNCYK